MPFISLFYPASDAAEHFVEGQHLEIAGPMFRTYAEAVRELEQETSDVFEQGLPVEPYVLEVKALRGGGGYSIVEVYEVSFPTMRGGARARNPREPKMVEMPELRGIRTGADRQLTLDEAAAVYGDFMAHNLPLGVPAGKVRRAFGAAVTPPSVERHRHEAAAIKQKAVGKVSSSVTKAVEAHGVDGAKALTEEKLEAVAEALDAGQITAAQAAPIIALESKRLEILDILQRFCPPVGEEGAAAIYEVTRAIFGGDEAAAEAGRLVLESVSSRFSSRPVEVDDSAVPAPKKGRTASKAAKTSAAGAAVFTGDVGAFVKAYGSRIRGDAKLVKAIVANAVGLAPFPVGFPVAELRDATSDVYALLAEAGVIAQPAVYSAPVYIPEPEPEPLPVAQFGDPGLQAIFGGLPVPPLPEQPDDYIMREYSYETGLPVYGMRFDGKLPPDRTPDLAQAIAVAERAGVQTHTYYDTALQSGGADFRPIEEAWERDAAERRFATAYTPEPEPAQVEVSKPYVPLSNAELGSPTAIREQKAYVALTSDPIRWVLNYRDALVNAPRTVKKYEEQLHNATVFANGAINHAASEGGDLKRALRNQKILDVLRYNATGTTLHQIEEEIRKIELGPVAIPEWARRSAQPVPEPPPAPVAKSDSSSYVTARTDSSGRRVYAVILNSAPIHADTPNAAQMVALARSQKVSTDRFWDGDRGVFAPISELEGVAAFAAPAVSAEEQLAAKIAASNDAGLARLQAMLNG